MLKKECGRQRLTAMLLILTLLACSAPGLTESMGEATPGEADRCEHERIEVRTTQEHVEYIQMNDSMHEKYYDELTVTTCLQCLMEINRSSVPKANEEAHVFDESGTCTLCGARDPALVETVGSGLTDDPTDAQGGEEASPSESAAAPETLPMFEVLFAAAQAALAGEADARVEIVGTQEMLTEEEYAALGLLSLEERIAVTLFAAGLGQAEQPAAGGMEISEEASALMRQIAARQEAEGKEALEQRLAQYFPRGEERVDGIARPTVEIGLRVEGSGGTQIRRYSFFEQESGLWMFLRMHADA